MKLTHFFHQRDEDHQMWQTGKSPNKSGNIKGNIVELPMDRHFPAIQLIFFGPPNRPSVSLPQGAIVRRHSGEVEGHIHAARPVAPGGRQNGDQTSNDEWIRLAPKGLEKVPTSSDM